MNWKLGISSNKSLLLLLLRHFSRVRLCVTPETGILQARTLESVAISFSKILPNQLVAMLPNELTNQGNSLLMKYICITELGCSTPKSNTILQILSSSMEEKKWKKNLKKRVLHGSSVVKNPRAKAGDIGPISDAE